MSRQRTIVAAAVLVYVNNKLFGKATSFRFSSQTPRDAILAIDSLDPFELAPTSTRCTGALEIVRTLGDGGAEGANLTTDYEHLSREKYFSIMLIERTTNTCIFRADFCSVVSQSWSATAKDRIHGSVEFEALDWSNEVKTLG